MSDLKLNLEKPAHGWVPVKLEYQEKIIEFESSDVPNNRIQGLIDAFVVTHLRFGGTWSLTHAYDYGMLLIIERGDIERGNQYLDKATEDGY